MIWLALDAYDPDRPEGDKGKSDYVTRKDVIRIVGLVVVVLGAIGWPIFQNMRKDADKHICTRNLKAIAGAIGTYTEVFDGRLPVAYQMGDNGAPYLENGKPVVWASIIAGQMPKGTSFTCPAAIPGEGLAVAGSTTEEKIGDAQSVKQVEIMLTYGLYAGMAAQPSALVPNPDEVVMVAETANFGANNTYNPQPFTDFDGKKIPYDGFLIGWDNGNEAPDSTTKSVTRLAFSGTANGNFDAPTVTGRHDQMIFGLSVSGQLRRLTPKDAKVENTAGRLRGNWRTN